MNLRNLVVLALLHAALLGQSHHWVMDAAHVKNGIVRPVRGKIEGAVVGKPTLVPHRFLGGVVLDGRNHRVILSKDIATVALPKKAFSVEAWVTIDRSQPWGGIISALQDNGQFEKGWVLGFRGDAFCFGLSTKGADDGDGFMTYLTATRPFVRGRRHHVMGTYDGKSQRIYVDGELVASSDAQSGPVLYPPHAPFELGAYHDADENFPIQGVLKEVAIFPRALNAAAVSERWKRRAPKPVELRQLFGWTCAPDRLADGVLRADVGPELVIEGPATLAEDTDIPALGCGLGGQVGVARTKKIRWGQVSALTVEAWVRPDQVVPDAGIIAVGTPDGSREQSFVLGVRGDRFAFGIATDGAGGDELGWVRAPEPFGLGQWHHVVGVFDGCGQTLWVNGILVAMNRERHGRPILPKGQSSLTVGTARVEGADRRFPGRLHAAAGFAGVLDAKTIQSRHRVLRRRFPQGLRLAASPFLRHVAQDVVEATWETRRPGTTVLRWGPSGQDMSRVVRLDGVRSKHRVRLEGVVPETVHGLVVATVPEGSKRELVTPVMEFDSTFEYLPVEVPELASPWPDDAFTPVYRRATERILAASGVREGFCLVLGSEEGRLAFEIARRTQLKIICVEPDAKKVARSRKALARTGFYGSRISVHHLPLENLPYADWFANLIVSDRTLLSGKSPVPAATMRRLLRPSGGVAVLGTNVPGVSASRLRQMTGAPSGQGEAIADGWATWRRKKLPGAGDWTHQYASPANTACSEDQLARGSMEVLWYGRPGPRPMVDRGARNPAPLSTGGRLFVQGDRILFGLDAYNGTMLWTLFVPQLRRANVPRDGSNMAATEDALFVCVGDACIAVDAQTGVQKATHHVPELPSDYRHAWGYLGLGEGVIVGSAVKEGGFYEAWNGEWYDGTGKDGYKVMSDWLFGLDAQGGKLRWTWQSGLVLNPTITAAGDRLWFVETRNPQALEKEGGRIGAAALTHTWLVCLERKTGRKIYERKVDVSRGERTVYLSHADGVLVLVTSGKRYDIQGLAAGTGRPLWQAAHGFARDHHGGAMQHPVIVGGNVYIEKKAYALKTGSLVRQDLPERRGCGTMAASAGAFYYRHYSHGVWDLKTNVREEYRGIRSGCWLGIIPAGGIVLAPEGSSGCSCADPIQTSMGLIPKR